MGSVSLRLTPEASRDIDVAFGWYLERSESAAAGFLRELERGLELIAETPGIWAVYEAGTRRMVMRRYPFSIIFRERSEELLSKVGDGQARRRWLMT